MIALLILIAGFNTHIDDNCVTLMWNTGGYALCRETDL